MKAFELIGTRPDGARATVFACGICGNVAHDVRMAEDCCATKACRTCGKVTDTGFVECNACRSAGYAAREQDCFDKAKKVTFAEYGGVWLYVDDDRYFSDLDSLLDHYDGEPADKVPTWAWATTGRKFSVDAQDVLESRLEDWFEDATDYIPDLTELQAALDKVAAEIPDCHEVDYGTVVLFEAEAKAFAEAHAQECSICHAKPETVYACYRCDALVCEGCSATTTNVDEPNGVLCRPCAGPEATDA